MTATTSDTASNPQGRHYSQLYTQSDVYDYPQRNTVPSDGSSSRRLAMATRHGSSYCSSSSSSSKTIPICAGRRRSMALEEQRLAELRAVADARDFVMYTRLVEGILRKQELIQRDVSLRYENQLLLDRIHRMRLSDTVRSGRTYRFRRTLNDQDQDDGNDGSLQDEKQSDEDTYGSAGTDDFIFDLEI